MLDFAGIFMGGTGLEPVTPSLSILSPFALIRAGALNPHS
jgi:hypothetical protein